MSRSLLKWTPALAAVVVVAGVAIAMPAAANASVSLPDKTPTQVLELVASSKVTAFSGAVEETSALGLPSIPSTGSSSGSHGGATADLALLTGSNTLRVYVDGKTHTRVQQLESLAEKDVVRNGSDVWVYDSKDNSVAHSTISERRPFARPGATSQGGDPAPSAQNPSEFTPDALARKLIAQLEKSSTLSVDPAIRVAGRPSYDLVLTPKASDTLIGSVSIAVDAETGLPLQVRATARGQKAPAVSVGFSSLDLTAPSASLFAFTPPAGAKVTEVTKPAGGPARQSEPVTKPTTTVTGHGWDAVVSVASTGSLAKLSKSAEFGELTTPATDGRILHTSILNVLFTTDGRILAGSVSVARLEAVASAQ